MASDIFRDVYLLIADPDREIAQVLKNALITLGFLHINVVNNGRQALAALKERRYDFMITDWQMPEVDGLQLVQTIRRHPQFPLPALPVLMLTAQAERDDVVTARDAGVNEFVVKPFTIRTVFDRIVQLIDHPRNFVLSPSYVGPDRRRKGSPPEGMADRRGPALKPIIAPKQQAGATDTKQPGIWIADHSIRMKVGGSLSLTTLVTPDMLDQAQGAIDTATDESVLWIRGDLRMMDEAFAIMQTDPGGAAMANAALCRAALAVKSRAGTFGYGFASEVAFAMYRFCHHRCDPKNTQHYQVIKKYIEVTKVIFGTGLKGGTTAANMAVLRELDQLADKYAG